MDEEELYREVESGRRTRNTRHSPLQLLQPTANNAEALLQKKMDLQKRKDDKLLADAGIPVEGMGEEEKRQILEALRESLPAGESSPSSSPAVLVEDEDASLPEDPLHQVVVASGQSDEERDQVCDSTTSSVVLGVNRGPSQQEMVSGYDRMGNVGVGARRSPHGKGEYNEAEESMTRRSPGRPLRLDTPQSPFKKENKETAEQEATSSAFFEGETMSSSVDIEISDSSSKDSDTGEVEMEEEDASVRRPMVLSPEQSKQMKLTPEQKEQSQTRLKSLLNNTSPVRDSGQSVSDREADGEEPASQPSQDLFADQGSEEEDELDSSVRSSQLSPSVGLADGRAVVSEAEDMDTRQKTKVAPPSPQTPEIVVQSESSGCGSDVGEWQGGENHGQAMTADDAATVPPEDFLLLSDEGESDGEGERTLVAGEEEEGGRSSPVDHVQTQPSAGPSSQAHSGVGDTGKISPSIGDTGRISPSMLPLLDEDDCRPLLHDNRFTWCSLLHVGSLQGRHRVPPREQKEPLTDVAPAYFCPKTENPEEYTKVIVRMFDAYFLNLTGMQGGLRTIPWGKPVRSGLHQADTLDWRRRGEAAFKLDWNLDEDDGEDFLTSRPPSKKQCVEEGGGKRKEGASQNLRMSARARRRLVAADSDGDGRTARPAPRDAGDTAAIYEGETRALDTDDELPDIQFGSSDRTGLQAGRAEGRTFMDPRGGGGSQSSNSLLDDNGDLYPTQLPGRKRRMQEDRDGAARGAERQKRACRTGPPSPPVASYEDSGWLRSQGGRKRKLTSSPNPADEIVISNDVDDDEDDEEVSFPRRKKVNKADLSERDFVHISSSMGSAAQQGVVRPGPSRKTDFGGQADSQSLGDAGEGRWRPERKLRVGPFRPDGDDSDDSVQLLEPSLLAGGERRDRVRSPPRSSEAMPLPDTAPSQSKEMTACPLCNKYFSASVIEEHASDCNGEEDVVIATVEQADRHPATSRRGPGSESQLRRQPLHTDMKRETFVCPLCNMDLGGSGALRRHVDRCKSESRKQEHSSHSRTFDLGGSHNAYSRPVMTRLNRDDDIEVHSDDSQKDPDFSLSREDRRQEREDLEDEGALGAQRDCDSSSARRTTVSSAKEDPVDLANQAAKKPRKKRAIKVKERQYN